MPEDFESVVENLSDMPAMPMVASKVLQMMQDPDVNAGELADAIAHDTVMTTQILKMANSSYYSLAHRVKTVDHAIVILGERTMRNLVLAASLRGVNRRFGLMEKMLWEDSIGCAVGARAVARRFDSADPEEAFLGGLLRHFGRIVMNAWDGERYLRVMEEMYNGEGSLEAMERRHFPTSHAMVGAAVLRKWNFSENLVRLVLNHDDFTFDPQEDPALYRLAATVNLAEHFCRRLGIGQRAPEPDRNLAITPGARALSLDHAAIETVLEEFEEAFARDRESFIS